MKFIRRCTTEFGLDLELYTNAIYEFNDAVAKISDKTAGEYQLGQQDMLPPFCIGGLILPKNILETYQRKFGEGIKWIPYQQTNNISKFPQDTLDYFNDISFKLSRIFNALRLSESLKFLGYALNVGSNMLYDKPEGGFTNPFDIHFDIGEGTKKPLAVIGFGYPGLFLRNHTVYYQPEPYDSIGYQKVKGGYFRVDHAERTIIYNDSLGRYLYPEINQDSAFLPIVANPGTVPHHAKALAYDPRSIQPYETTPTSWFLGLVYGYK